METTYLHRVDSSSSRRVIIVRQNSFKDKPTTSINNETNSQHLSTMITSVPTEKKRRKSLFKYVTNVYRTKLLVTMNKTTRNP